MYRTSQSARSFQISINRGLQALSVQFRFAFSKPQSSQTRFLNRPVAAPAEVAHCCRYEKFYFSTNLRFEGWILQTKVLSFISTLQNANWSKNKIFCSDRSALLRRAPQLDGLENEFANSTVQKTQIGTGRLMLVATETIKSPYSNTTRPYDLYNRTGCIRHLQVNNTMLFTSQTFALEFIKQLLNHSFNLKT